MPAVPIASARDFHGDQTSKDDEDTNFDLCDTVSLSTTRVITVANSRFVEPYGADTGSNAVDTSKPSESCYCSRDAGGYEHADCG